MEKEGIDRDYIVMDSRTHGRGKRQDKDKDNRLISQIHAGSYFFFFFPSFLLSLSLYSVCKLVVSSLDRFEEEKRKQSPRTPVAEV